MNFLKKTTATSIFLFFISFAEAQATGPQQLNNAVFTQALKTGDISTPMHVADYFGLPMLNAVTG